jgi:hypothetical protein
MANLSLIPYFVSQVSEGLLKRSAARVAPPIGSPIKTKMGDPYRTAPGFVIFAHLVVYEPAANLSTRGLQKPAR